jgi:hypothetical protein
MSYKRGDIISALDKTLLVVKVLGDKVVVFNMLGNGKAQYKLPLVHVRGKLGEALDHPWLQAEKALSPKRSEDAKLPIHVRQDGDKWYAEVEGREGDFWADGNTVQEAVGNLIIVHGETLGISLSVKNSA